MRNLKRVLSLALALVMVLGMMVITTSAADFTDAEEITYEEAVDVISAIGVITGYPDGTFAPKGTLTREQGAALICYLLMGKEAADKLTGSGNFTDVAADRWSAGEIDYCVNLGYIAGNGDGTFNPEGPLTAVAYGKLLLCALGYDAKLEGYTGANWASAIASDMIEAGLDVDGVSMDAQLTREAAAQMTLQALKATMVEYDDKGTDITIGDTTVNTGASEADAKGVIYDALGNPVDYTVATLAGNGTLQFVEKYFSNLTLDAGDDDDFGRPSAYKWVLTTDRAKTVYNATRTPVMTYTEGFTNKEYNALVANDYDFTGAAINVNGTIPTDIVNVGGPNAATDLAAREYAGTVIEMYNTDRDADTIEKVVVIQGYLTKVDRIVSTNKVATSNYITLKVYNPWEGTYVATVTLNDTASKTVPSDYDKLVAKYTKGDYMITYFEGGQALAANYITAEDATFVDATVNAKKLTANFSGTIVADGVTYTMHSAYAEAATVGGNPVLGVEYTLALDPNGYVIGAINESIASTDYAYLVDVNAYVTTTIDGTTPYVEGRFVLADGTVAVYEIALDNARGTENYWIKNIGSASDPLPKDNIDTKAETDLAANIFGYVLADGVITLEPLSTTLAANAVSAVNYGSDSIAKNETSVVANEGTVLLTKDTVYVVYNTYTKTAEVLTGNAGLGDTALTGFDGVVKGNPAGTLGTATIVFATVAGGVEASASNYAYIDESEVTLTGTAAQTKYVYTGILPDGSEITLTADAALSVSAAGSLYEYTEDMTVSSSDKITYTAVNTFTNNESITWGRMFVNGDMMNFNGGSTYYDITNANVVYINPQLDEIDNNAGFVVCKKVAGNTVIETIYVIAD